MMPGSLCRIELKLVTCDLSANTARNEFLIQNDPCYAFNEYINRPLCQTLVTHRNNIFSQRIQNAAINILLLHAMCVHSVCCVWVCVCFHRAK